jgi:cytidylate kinase
MGEQSRPLVVALDGPAGVGKSTVAMRIARELGLAYVETGALYRAVGLVAQRRGLSMDDEAGLARLAAGLAVSFRMDGDTNHVLLDGEDVTAALRLPHMGPVASRVSAYPAVRTALLALQRGFGERLPGAVAEGRDIGTVVFPNATHKFFLTGEVQERVRRRHKQLLGAGRNVPVESLVAEIEERDRADSGRKVAPLVPAGDAVVIDTTRIDADEVVRRILARVREGSA